ncbi:hypothetical protein EYF80_041975 [Liparis tanakae]|uniref:Uncharacterized protein n=1 Tax=Liparis tanakae TaxID=230148 RepID=A0A4Z2G5G6_9TELE|nr:hypothetical protein EYF80_041975 [Liparis tanakae]
MVGPHPSAAWEGVLSAPRAAGCQAAVPADLSLRNAAAVPEGRRAQPRCCWVNVTRCMLENQK